MVEINTISKGINKKRVSIIILHADGGKQSTERIPQSPAQTCESLKKNIFVG